MGRKRQQKNPTSACTCDVCGIKDPSTIQGTKHRRCGGGLDVRLRPKHSPNSGIRGYWR